MWSVLITFSLSIICIYATPQEVINLPAGYQNEGVTRASGNTFFTSAFNGAILSVDPFTKLITTVVPPQSNRTAIGISTTKDRLFVAGGGPLSSFDNRRTAFFVYDVALGTGIAECEIQDGGFVNDVTIDATFAYFTNSFRPVIYKLPIETAEECKIERIPLPETIFSSSGAPNFRANGIIRFHTGLIVANSGAGTLYFVDLEENNIVYPITPPNSTFGADGLDIRRTGNTGIVTVAMSRLSEIALISVNVLNNRVVGNIFKRTKLTGSVQGPTTIALFETGNKAVVALPRFREVAPGTPGNQTFSVGVVQIF